MRLLNRLADALPGGSARRPVLMLALGAFALGTDAFVISGVLPKIASDLGPQVSHDLLYRVVDAIDLVAAETGRTVPQIALNWLLRRPSVATLITGARTEEQLRDNLGAVGWTLTPQQVTALERASATPLVYPYWHQRGFADRNPPPV